MAAEYEVNIKLNSKDIETQLDGIGKKISKLGKSKGGSARKKSGIAGLLPSTQELKAQERGITQLIDKFAQRKERAIARSNALNKVELRLNKELVRQARNRVRLQGANAMQGKGRMAAEGINTRTNVQERKLKLVNKVNELEAKGLNVQKFRTQIGKISEQQSAKRFTSAEKEIRLLRKMLEIDQSRARILRSERQNFPSSPVRGTRAMMGSPAQIAASGRQRVSPIGGRLDIAGSPAQINAISRLERAEIRAAKNVHMAKLPLVQKRQKIRLNNIDKLFKEDVKKLAAFDKKLAASDAARAKRHAGSQIKGLAPGQTAGPSPRAFGPFAASPVGGTMGTPGSPAFNKGLALGKFRSTPIRGGANIAGSPLARLGGMKKLEQIGLGAGFPLLFGGGAGSILGGAVGGAMGSFGAQIAFSAIGQQVDAFIASVVNVGTALTSASGTIEMFREKNLFSSDAVKEHALQLEEQGKMQELATVLAKDLASQIGKNAVESFQVLGDETKEFLRIINHLFLAVQGFVAGPLAKFLSAINTVLGGVSADIQFGSLQGSLTGEARAEFDKIVAEKQGTRNLTARERQRAIRKGESTDPVLGRLTSKVKQEVLKDSRIEKLRQTIAIKGRTNLDDRLGLKPPKNAAAEKAAREEERLQKRLAKLDQERLKVIEISRFKEKIALAEAAGDAQRVIRLQGEQRLAEIEQRRLDKLIGVTNQQEIQKINSLALARTQAAQLETDRKLTEEQRKRQEFFDDTVQGLEHQLALATATTETEREQLRIQERLRKLGEDNNLSGGQLSRIGGLMQQLSEANSPINKFITQSVNSLNNLEQRAVQVSQSIGSAIGSSLVNGLQGLITGAQSVKEVFANMLKSIANILAEQAAQMIGTYIAIGIARLFAGMGSGGGPDPNSAGVGSVLQGGGFTTGNMADQAVAGTFKYAQGGYVSRPTNALIGEGGEPEYVIPESKMRTAMSRYSRGSRGNSVIPESGATEAMGEGGGTAVAAPIDVRYTVERINSIDYVTADQFQTGMQQAAQQGAKQGEQQTLKRLQMSGSTRKRIGI